MAHTHRPTATALLIEELDSAFDRRSWHGPNLVTALRGVSPQKAVVSPRGRKSIWQQLLHALYWKHRVLSRLFGPRRLARTASNWAAPPHKPTAAAWRADVALLRQTHAELREAVAKLPAARLDPKTRWLIHGAAAHDLYHAGQIKLLRRLIGQA